MLEHVDFKFLELLKKEMIRRGLLKSLTVPK